MASATRAQARWLALCDASASSAFIERTEERSDRFNVRAKRNDVDTLLANADYEDTLEFLKVRANFPEGVFTQMSLLISACRKRDLWIAEVGGEFVVSSVHDRRKPLFRDVHFAPVMEFIRSYPEVPNARS
jgi:hypothetical protein